MFYLDCYIGCARTVQCHHILTCTTRTCKLLQLLTMCSTIVVLVSQHGSTPTCRKIGVYCDEDGPVSVNQTSSNGGSIHFTSSVIRREHLSTSIDITHKHEYHRLT